jgi:hypothetical protein
MDQDLDMPGQTRLDEPGTLHHMMLLCQGDVYCLIGFIEGAGA